jgi:signal transduction histidine kinase
LVGEWDGERLRRVLANLISNAIKYSPDGGAVTITVDRNGAMSALSVRDRGVGIPVADQPHLFEQFRRASNVIGRIAGTGIGLAAARLSPAAAPQ